MFVKNSGKSRDTISHNEGSGSIDSYDDTSIKRKPSKQGIFSQLLFGDKEIQQMRKAWRNDLINIENSLDNIESQLEKLEKLCKDLNRLLGDDNNKNSNFELIGSDIQKLRKHVGDGKEITKNLQEKVFKYKFEETPGYKNSNKEKQEKIKDTVNKLISQTTLVSQAFNNNVINSTKNDDEIKKHYKKFLDDEDESIVESSDGDSSIEVSISEESLDEDRKNNKNLNYISKNTKKNWFEKEK